MFQFFKKFYETLISFGNALQSPILLLCRLYWGWLFMTAGWEKLGEIPHFVQLLQTYHFRFPSLMAYLAAGSEFIGGLCLLIGFASRLAAIPLIITMLTAYFTVHIVAIQRLIENPSVFVAESPFNFLLTALLILAFGPGLFSIDGLLEKLYFAKKNKAKLEF